MGVVTKDQYCNQLTIYIVFFLFYCPFLKPFFALMMISNFFFDILMIAVTFLLC